MPRKERTSGAAGCRRLIASFSILTFVTSGRSCSTPPAGCTKDKCNGLSTLSTPLLSSNGYLDKRIGWYYGSFNNAINGGNPTGYTSVRGGPFVNYEVFPAVETTYLLSVDTSSINSLAACCLACAQADGCFVYQFFANKDYTKIKTIFGDSPRYPPYNFLGDRQCYLLSGGSDKAEQPKGAPYSGTHTMQIATSGYPNRYYPPSWVGGSCNGNASVVDDPHFTGAQGTRFEFNGEIDKSFCLLTDERLQINALLGGYEDSRTVGATVLKNGKALRTWIKEVGLLWTDPDGTRHHAWMVARKGKQQERSEGFLARLTVDGVEHRAPMPGQHVRVGTFEIECVGVHKRGPLDVEYLVVTISGLLEMHIRMRAAHPLLQTEGDAQVHFNLHIKNVEATSRIHGILGQTFREDPMQRLKSLEYRLLTRLLGAPIVADGDSGLGFLDGQPADYITSGVLAADNKHAVYN